MTTGINPYVAADVTDDNPNATVVETKIIVDEANVDRYMLFILNADGVPSEAKVIQTALKRRNLPSEH